MLPRISLQTSLVLVLSACALWACYRTTAAADRLERLDQLRNTAMSWTTVTVRKGGPGGDVEAEFSTVTNYQEHDNGVSFNYVEGGVTKHASFDRAGRWITCV